VYPESSSSLGLLLDAGFTCVLLFSPSVLPSVDTRPCHKCLFPFTPLCSRCACCYKTCRPPYARPVFFGARIDDFRPVSLSFFLIAGELGFSLPDNPLYDVLSPLWAAHPSLVPASCPSSLPFSEPSITWLDVSLRPTTLVPFSPTCFRTPFS